MDLAKVIEQLAAVGRRMKESAALQESMTAEAEKLATKYTKTEHAARSMQTAMRDTLPTSTLARLKELEGISARIPNLAKAQAVNESKVHDALLKRHQALAAAKLTAEKLEVQATRLRGRGLHDEITAAKTLYDLHRKRDAALRSGDGANAAMFGRQLVGALADANIRVRKLYDAFGAHEDAVAAVGDVNALLDAARDSAHETSVEFAQSVKEYNALKKALKGSGVNLASSNKIVEHIEHTDQLNVKLAIMPKLWRSLIAPISTIVGLTGLGGLLGNYQAALSLLKQINSSVSSQSGAVRAANRIAAQTGIEFDAVVEAQKALIDVGLKGLINQRATVASVSLIHETLEVSVAEAADLARWSRLVGADFSKAAGAAGLLVDRTALVGHESVGLARNMAQTARELGVAFDRLPDAVAAVGALSSRVKELGGNASAVTGILDRFKSLEGIGDAALFGGFGGFILDPAALGNVERLNGILQSTASTIASLTRGGKDPLMLNALAPMFQRLGLTLADAKALAEIGNDPTALRRKVSELRAVQSEQRMVEYLQSRYSDQLSVTSRSLGALWTRVTAIAGLLLNPIAQAIGHVANFANKMIDAATALLRSADKVPILGAALRGIGWISMATATVAVASALTVATLAATRYAWSLRAVAASMAMNTLGLGGISRAGGVRGLLTGLLGRTGGLGTVGASVGRIALIVARFIPHLAIISAGVAASLAIFKWYKDGKENRAKLDTDWVRQQQARAEAVTSRARLRQQLNDRFGDPYAGIVPKTRAVAPDAKFLSNPVIPQSKVTPVTLHEAVKQREAAAKLERIAEEVVKLRGAVNTESTATRRQTKELTEGDRQQRQALDLHRYALTPTTR